MFVNKQPHYRAIRLIIGKTLRFLSARVVILIEGKKGKMLKKRLICDIMRRDGRLFFRQEDTDV